MTKWTDEQKARVKKSIAHFTVNDPMIVSEQMMVDLRENNMLDRERTLLKTDSGLVVHIPWINGLLWKGDGKPKGPVR